MPCCRVVAGHWLMPATRCPIGRPRRSSILHAVVATITVTHHQRRSYKESTRRPPHARQCRAGRAARRARALPSLQPARAIVPGVPQSPVAVRVGALVRLPRHRAQPGRRRRRERTQPRQHRLARRTNIRRRSGVGGEGTCPVWRGRRRTRRSLPLPSASCTHIRAATTRHRSFGPFNGSGTKPAGRLACIIDSGMARVNPQDDRRQRSRTRSR